MWILVWLCGEVLLLESVSVINWCFCKHYPDGKVGLQHVCIFYCSASVTAIITPVTIPYPLKHLKRINMLFLFDKNVLVKLRKNQGKIIRKSGNFTG